MSTKLAPSIFSRLLLVVAALLVVVFTYWLIATLLAPASVPLAPGSRGVVSFDPKLDVSKDETFFRLQPLGPLDPTKTPSGRTNPFVPPLPPAIATSTAPTTTAPLIPTSTLPGGTQ
jgi:hypothetical protein